MVDVGCKVAVTSGKLLDLGWEPRKLEETLADSVECSGRGWRTLPATLFLPHEC